VASYPCDKGRLLFFVRLGMELSGELKIINAEHIGEGHFHSHRREFKEIDDNHSFISVPKRAFKSFLPMSNG